MALPLGGVRGSQQQGWAAALRDLTDTIIVATFSTMSTKYTWHESKRQSNEGSRYFCESLFRGIPAPTSGKKIRDRHCLRPPRFVRVTWSRPDKGTGTAVPHDFTPFRDALQVAYATLRQPARPYGYRGLKIFASLRSASKIFSAGKASA